MRNEKTTGYRKNNIKHFAFYVFFGLCTTAVNVFSYYVCSIILRFENIISVIIAWLLAVFFAFITNKIWVFESRSLEKKILIWELSSYYICRAGTGLSDVLIMFLAVDIMNANAVLWKIISNVFAIILNYVASRLVVFRK